MTATICDPWIERLITSGELAPGARGMSREEAARQYNQANALDPADDGYLYTPGQAQEAARAALAMVDISVDDNARVLLTDATGGQRCWTYLVEPGQVEFACEQHRLISGEALSAEAIMGALTWI